MNTEIMTAAGGPDSNHGKKGRARPYAWLAAGALTLGIAAAVGSGTAYADAGSTASTAEGARSAGPTAKSSVRDSAQRRGAASSKPQGSAQAEIANSERAQLANPVRRAATAISASGGKASATATTPCQTQIACGAASFFNSGAPQTWTVPTGVNSAYFEVIGGNGAQSPPVAPSPSYATGGPSVPLYATIQFNAPSFQAPVTELTINVGGNGQTVSPTFPEGGGAGGYNGGGAGGSGSGTDGIGGGGGGGATTVAISAGGPSGAGTVLVGGGGGGGGGSRYSTGGTGGQGGEGPASNGVFAGGNGTAGPTDNGGDGGAGSNQSSQNGTDGGGAEDLSNNAGGGGGGAGWRGGSGGQAGQGDLIGYAGDGGGGGGGSSYADPTLTTNVSLGTAGSDPAVIIQWVDIITTNLARMKAGRSTSQQLSAIYADAWNNPVTWVVSGGTLPVGLELSATGQLTGTPKKAEFYQFQVTATATDGLASSVTTYTGTVCSRRCGRRD